MPFDFSLPEVTVDSLKGFLVENDYDPNSLKGVRKAELVETIVNDGLTNSFANYLNITVTNDEEEEFVPKTPDKPKRGTDEWNQYVLGLFTKDERVVYKTGNKEIDAVRADGLRRVGELVLGDVLFSGPVTHNLDYSGPKSMPAAQVQYKIVIRGNDGITREYGALGEVSYLNTENEFLGFALLTAETRAKGRAWREALGVKTYAVEEFSGKKDTTAAVEEVSSADWKEQSITTSQQRSIKNMSSKLNIDIYKLLNVGTDWKYDASKPQRYDGLDDENLTNKGAAKLIKRLNDMQQGIHKVDESLLLSD